MLRIADEDDLSPAIQLVQLAAAASPNSSITEIVGNFGDFDTMFKQLGRPVVFELGRPLPKTKNLPRQRAGACPTKHNEALTGRRPIRTSKN
jgi:hypothetical protein